MFTKKYVDVIAAFSERGLFPMELIWEDGRRYEIDCVYDVRPGASYKTGGQGDRYTVCIRGQKRYLFFEHAARRDDPSLGRWFIEYPIQKSPSFEY